MPIATRARCVDPSNATSNESPAPWPAPDTLVRCGIRRLRLENTDCSLRYSFIVRPPRNSNWRTETVNNTGGGANNLRMSVQMRQNQLKRCVHCARSAL